MKRFNPKLDQDEYKYPYATMEESKCGKYVLAEDAFIEAGYKWSLKDGCWKKPKNSLTKQQ